MSAPVSPSVPATFESLGLQSDLCEVLAGLGYEEPTPVQRESIPVLLAGHDLLGQAATGTGKTAAFALPMLQLLAGGRPRARQTCGLVLVPTRELAMQVAEAIHKYAKGLGLSVLPLYGGAPMHSQISALNRGAHVVVATPGRALDHLRRETLSLAAVEFVVLDEADEMLDMGFAEDIEAILAQTPEGRQTALFSATMPVRILGIAARHLKDPARVSIAREKVAAGSLPRVRQVAYVVQRAHKPAALERLLDMEDPAATLVFCRTRQEVETLVETLHAHGHRAEALHGGMAQRQRDRVMTQFRAQQADLLVATDVAARGLDIDHLSHVVNYDVPSAPEVYTHRIGRTGRAGRAGVAITLAEPREHRLLRSIEHFTKTRIDMGVLPTVADLRARRLDLTRASLREQLVAGNFDSFRIVVETLAQEFDILDVAAAAVKMSHDASGGERDEIDIPVAQERPRTERRVPREPAENAGAAPREPSKGRAARWAARGATGGWAERVQQGSDTPGDEPRGGATSSRARRRDGSVRLFIGAGRQAGIRPGDLVGAITGEAGIGNRDLGAIEIADKFSLVEVPEGLADQIIAAMKKTTLRGKRVTIRRERFD